MVKIKTLFKKDPNDLGRVIPLIEPDNSWVSPEMATRKFDGTAAAIINGVLHKRYDAKKGKQPPSGAIPCCDPDPITGHHPHWIVVDATDPADRYFIEAMEDLPDGTYELCGPKINGNREKLGKHTLIPHGKEKVYIEYIDFDYIREYLSKVDIEGIVFHGPEGQMCKIRKSDFGIKR